MFQETHNPFEFSLAAYVEKYQLGLCDIAEGLPEVKVGSIALRRDMYANFLANVLTNHAEISPKSHHKKKLEMFISHSLLNIRPKDVYMDAAGGGFSYAGKVATSRTYMQDISIRKSVRDRLGPTVECIESSVGKVPLAAGSVDKISCHHAFEHFQLDADIEFIKEAQRILRPGGRLVIVPIFISKREVEFSNLKEFKNWSTKPENRLVDMNATLPGKKSGNFARIYSLASFRERILSKIDFQRFDVEIVEPLLGGTNLPEPRNYITHKISNFNFPYRALCVTSKG
jgi:predicted SAM-dependent methyltransferase